MWGFDVCCECFVLKEYCKRGINQCKVNLGLCVDEGKVCIEFYDENFSWSLGDEQEGFGFVCFLRYIVKLFVDVMYYCDVFSEIFMRIGGVELRNELDLCCYCMLICVGGKSFF